MYFIIQSIYFLLLFNIVVFCSKPKLNVPRVLLPYRPNHDDFASNFTLKVQGGGCYKWLSSRDEVVLEKITSTSSNGCSTEAVVFANSRSASRLTAIIIANDIDTGLSLRCDVIVDAIDSLQIVTTTRQLYAEEAPEVFEVRAYDVQGNEFTTLEGHKFVWDLHPITNQEGSPIQTRTTVLRFITFKDSPYKTPPSIAPIEAAGDQGYMVLVEGIQTGLARLTVRLAHSAYKKLPTTAVDLMVVANLILEPQDIYILPYTSVMYSVMHLKQGIFHPVNIAHSQYYLQVSDTSIGELESDGIYVTGLALGTTSVILSDRLVKSSEALKEPTATLNVVEPSYLTISIQPHNNPALIVGNDYDFVITLFDNNNHRIYITDNIVVESLIPEDHFSTQFISTNGTFISAIPIQTGTTKITAKLSTIKIGPYEEAELSPPLKASQTIEIFQKISVVPKYTFLPWDPIMLPTYKVNLTVDKYNDSVSWSSSNTSSVSVNRWGICQTNGSGVTTITASLIANPHNNDAAQIIIQEALQMYIIEDVVEVEVNNTVFLPIALSTVYSNSEYFFSVCNKLPFLVKPDQSSFEALKDVLPGSKENSCAEIKLKSVRGGFSTVTVSYASSSGKLESDAVVSAFYPLRPVSPVSSISVLALGTSRFIIFEGGPLPWIKKPSAHFASVEVNSSEDELLATLQPRIPVNRVDIYSVHVTCIELGSFTLTLTVGNKPSSTLPFPKVVSSSVTVVCAVPESLILHPLLTNPLCPSLHSPELAVAHYRKPIPVEVEIQDAQGRKFDNASSLFLNWKISDKALASFPAHLSESKDFHQLHGYDIPKRIERDIHPHGLRGNIVITVTMTGYSFTSLQHISLPSLEDSLQIHLVGDATLNPQQLVVYNHEEIQEEIKINGGSGFFQLVSQNSSVALFELSHDKQKVTIIPKGDGNMTLSVQDLCLPGAHPANSSIQVSSIASIDLNVPSRVEISSSISAEAIVRDIFGNIIPAHALMNITPHLQSNIISVSSQGISEGGNALYIVKGVIAGDTQIKLSSRKNILSSILYSSPKPIQVFPPLRIMPRNITLIVGAVFQFETKGGPYPESAVEFSLQNETVASTSYTGIVTALNLGTTLLTAVIKDQLLNVISQDAVLVTVIPLDSLRIYSPLRHIETGSIVPLHIIGPENLTPMSYGTANPPLIFDWLLSNEQIAVIMTAYEQNGIIEPKENLFVIWFKAVKPGRVTISVRINVSVPHPSIKHQIRENIVLTDKIEIKIFETLKLSSPFSEDARILLSPKAQTTIITNREKEGGLTYTYDTFKASSNSLIEVSTEGVVFAKTGTGETSVLISLEKPFGVTQNIAVGIEVRSISYILSSPELFMDAANSNLFGKLPLGVSHTIKLQYHDNRGRMFTSTNVVPEFRLSRFDIVNISPGPTNDTFTLTVRDFGETILHVWLKDNPLINDYLKISCGPGISPHKPSVPLGGLVCFSSSLRGLNGSKGVWKSGSPMFEIDPENGVGTGHQVGKFSVTYQISQSVATTTEVQVVPITKIILESANQPISNTLDSAGVFIPVNLIGEGNSAPESQCYKSFAPKVHFPYHCNLSIESELPISVHDLFSVTPAYFPEKGFGCDITSISGPELTLSTSNLHLHLQCIVTARGPQREVVSEPVSIPFLPSALSDREEIILTNKEPSKEVILHGKENVLDSFIMAEENRNLYVRSENVDELRRRFIFTAKEFFLNDCLTPEPSEIVLVSILTHQVVKISVKFDAPGFGQCTRREISADLFGFDIKWLLPYQSHFIFFMCVLITAICLYFGYQAITSTSYKQTQNQSVFASNVTPQSPMPVGSPFSPGKRSLVAQSPSTVPLWTDDKEPVYGIPIYRSSPRPAYDGSSTYS